MEAETETVILSFYSLWFVEVWVLVLFKFFNFLDTELQEDIGRESWELKGLTDELSTNVVIS